ncbi:hypothetical protein P7K49_032959 [Saguinus oedipus]|uniref:CRAL-TRIO domain-containing protein n=1 Tax=Saguinus oedipus TaxID=9490 RepID=A0ABQ9TS93_SAGOE|nr:hypothetical protein P7K49_032959 [Saguinus oedipus]
MLPAVRQGRRQHLDRYVISSLELLVAEDYMIVYLNGATPRRRMPGIGWLKKCYQMIDRRLRKNLKSLIIVHPSWFIRTVLAISRPFISVKFINKIQYVHSLEDLEQLIPMEHVQIPDCVLQYEEERLKARRESTRPQPEFLLPRCEEKPEEAPVENRSSPVTEEDQETRTRPWTWKLNPHRRVTSWGTSWAPTVYPKFTSVVFHLTRLRPAHNDTPLFEKLRAHSQEGPLPTILDLRLQNDAPVICTILNPFNSDTKPQGKPSQYVPPRNDTC